MMEVQTTTQDIESNLHDLFDILSRGQFVEAMQKYHHDDVVLREGNGDPKHGKAFCIAFEEEVLKNVGEFIRYEVLDYAVNGDTSFYEAVMEYKEINGNHVRVEQAVVSKWSDDTIVSERFYHA